MLSDLPKRVEIFEEGPREGFQIEAGAIASDDKVRLIEALAETGVKHIQCVSFVNPKRVPGMADADFVASQVRRRPDVAYTGIWLNLQGLERAMRTPLHVSGELQAYASESFGLNNSNRSTERMLAEQRKWLEFYVKNGIALESAVVMTAFGCNFEGRISPERVCDRVAGLVELTAEFGLTIPRMRLADTVGWATPDAVMRVLGMVRSRWPDLPLALHLHDTRGSGLANCFAGLSMGVASFDSSCAGLGGCPFAGHAGAAGNICTEDFVFMCEEMGIATGIDLDRMADCARMAERIVGHQLPGKVMRSGGLRRRQISEIKV